MDIEMVPITMDKVVKTASAIRIRFLELLSRLLLRDDSESGALAQGRELRMLSDWDSDDVSRFLAFTTYWFAPSRHCRVPHRETWGRSF